tara:strand:- start:121 stop:702 length:582 start_codon:yes stop_codon:yes gene_type:complete
MKRLLLICSGLIALVSCATPSPSLNYYLLDSGVGSTSIVGTAEQNKNERLVLVGDVTLGEFLRQSSLLVELDDNEMHFAMNHVWAEPLVEQIPKVLLKDLRRSNTEFHFERETSEWFGKEVYSVKIQIDQFHPNARQEVVMSGRYWVTDIGSGQTKEKDFFLSDTLTEDNYGHAIVKMRRLITVLSESLIRSL